jgi:hypothetical protein
MGKVKTNQQGMLLSVDWFDHRKKIFAFTP